MSKIFGPSSYAHNKNKNDEFYTRKEDVEKFLDKFDFTGLDIVCPCDSDDSEIYKYLKAKGYNVDNATEFEKVNFSKYHIVITNPPFSKQNQFYEQCWRQVECVISVMTTFSIYINNIDSSKYHIDIGNKLGRRRSANQAYMKALNFKLGDKLSKFITETGEIKNVTCQWIYTDTVARYLKKEGDDIGEE